MPKESTHLFLSHAVIEKIETNSTFRNIYEIINKSPKMFYAGSVSPDSIFNYLNGSAKVYFKQYANYSHNSNSHNIFAFLQRFANEDLPFMPALSFALGTISHFTADMIFHPVVFYFTGKDKIGSDEAEIRHYKFESCLDKTIRWLNPWLKDFHLPPFTNLSREERFTLTKALEIIHLPPEQNGKLDSKEFVSMYKQHTHHESLYGKGSIFFLTSFINFITKGKKEKLNALFYADIRKQSEEEDINYLMNKKINFNNPATGIECSKSLSVLIKDFLYLFMENVTPIAKALNNISPEKNPEWADIENAFDKIPSRNPATGLISYYGENNKTQPMTFFKIRSFDSVW
ncbi:MAG: zinc dependent phospholipase C family protein [Spirochaetales bacterium]|nr:zinc dependent phospholipase C family protein [Spirochaetales bacterium]